MLWHDARGTAPCSPRLLLEPPDDRRLPELSLASLALAVAETIETAVVLAAQVKWPNDVMLNRRKVAGILSAALRRDGRRRDRDQRQPDPRRASARRATEPGSLRTATGTTFDRAVLLGSLLSRLERMYDIWSEEGLDGIYGGLGARDFLRGRRITADGEFATAVQIRRDGRLEIETDAGEVKALESGEVLFER